jgi:hypothetical protein
MQDLVDRGVEQIAVMADDDHGARIVRQMVLQPQRAFEIEIVGGLVQQQQVGLGEQGRGERHAHPPAAGKFRTGPRLIGGGKSEAAEDRGGAGRGRMRVDIHQPGLNVGDAGRIVRGLGFVQQRRSRSRSAFSTTSIRLSGPSGASCARLPTRQRGGPGSSTFALRAPANAPE